jgi:hypothetical protein
MIKLTDIINEIELDKVEFVSPNEAGFDYYDSLNQLVISSGLYIKLYKELLLLAIKDERVIGALFGGLRGKTFEFDVMVDKNEKPTGLQKNTIGSKLINFGIQEFKSLQEMSDVEYKLKLDVVNPNLISYLERLGFHKKVQYPNHVIMEL